jgi:hypothetical protein
MPIGSPAPAPRGLWKQVLIPGEHGSWAFLAEPILLGLLVRFSPAGLLVALAAAAGFLARRPLRLWFSDRRKGRRYPRTIVAERAFAMLALLAAAALAGGVMLARGPVLLALGLGAPLAALALTLDLGARSRELAAELAGTLALGAVAPAIALAGGRPPRVALGLALLAASRIVPSILYVRARLRLERNEAGRVGLALAVNLLAAAGLALLAARGVIPWAGALAVVLLAARAGLGLSPLRPRASTVQLGVSEIVFGLVFVAAASLGWPERP